MDSTDCVFGLLMGFYAAIFFAIAATLVRFFMTGEKRDFLKVIYDGGWIILTPVEAFAMLQEAEDPKSYRAVPVFMTTKEFEAIPEFDGF